MCHQAYSAALQTQWQWVNQLCLCVEEHLKDNSAYFQVKEINYIEIVLLLNRTSMLSKFYSDLSVIIAYVDFLCGILYKAVLLTFLFY